MMIGWLVPVGNIDFLEPRCTGCQSPKSKWKSKWLKLRGYILLAAHPQTNESSKSTNIFV